MTRIQELAELLKQYHDEEVREAIALVHPQVVLRPGDSVAYEDLSRMVVVAIGGDGERATIAPSLRSSKTMLVDAKALRPRL